ncbi:DUF6034 family protein [Christensenella hongkongensis]|uniref:Uncharacterized protein n=1 Tax=Christensenella hongkongensis TaxID=270498 RepID=A0A0M2NHD4_9FIRM|nr:DUF6034 family protein [Christensenella hongkongensis]KKI51553.1 hypothetical protein CHK_0951 [Christensenella hongkongensis]TCW30667.1 hypothetical protein EV208_102293 [Christensenella hongkongensis]
MGKRNRHILIITILIVSFILVVAACSNSNIVPINTINKTAEAMAPDKETYPITKVEKKIFTDEQILSYVQQFTNSTEMYSDWGAIGDLTKDTSTVSSTSQLILSELESGVYHDAYIKQADGSIAQCTFARNHNNFAYRKNMNLEVYPQSLIDEDMATYMPKSPSISKQSAHEQALEYANDIGANDLSLFTEEACTIVLDGEIDSYGWIFTFTRNIDGLQKIYYPSSYYLNPNVPPDYGSPWEPEFLRIAINEEGLCLLWYEGACKITNEENMSAKIEDVDTMEAQAIDTLQKIFASSSTDEEALDINITKFELGIDLLSSEKKADQGEYIPTWTVNFDYGYPDSTFKSQSSIVLNAIDGSYIEPRVTNQYLAGI